MLAEIWHIIKKNPPLFGFPSVSMCHPTLLGEQYKEWAVSVMLLEISKADTPRSGWISPHSMEFSKGAEG